MASSSISGLASGLDTATIITQLMQLEAIPQARLQSRVTTEERQVTSLTTLNSKFASLATRAADLAKADGWSPLKATSTNDKVTVTTATGAGPGSFTLTVGNTALTHRLEFAGSTDLTTPGTVPTSVRLDRIDAAGQPGDPADVVDLTTDGTLQGLVTAINDPANDTGLRATAVKVGTDQYRLLVESTATGADSDFTLKNAADGTDLLGGATVRAGLDATITLGSSITATSATNTFADLVPGVSITLAADATGTSEIAVTRDTTKISGDVKAFVDSINAALGDIASLTAYSSTTKAAGILAGEGSVRGLGSQLLNSIYPTDGTSLASLGIEVDRTGKLVFDEAAFKTAYAADPAGVAAQFTTGTADGFAARVQKVADAASNTTNGTLTMAITGRNDGIERLKDSIEQWDIRLELRRTALTRQFTALETALSRMNSQSNWLAGQLATLPTTSSGS
jgi:flagellar hook-associated protein 2